MGKIRIKTLGVEDEEKQKKELKQRKEAKKTAKAPGLKGGERVVAVGPTEEELTKIEQAEKTSEPKAEVKKEEKKTKKTKAKPARKRSSKYKAVKELVEPKKYGLGEAVELLKKLKTAKFDETVELHVNTTEPGISGNITLPHGTGKKTRVEIADEKIIAEVEKGKINFDILVATPDMMPKLAKVARVLGPRGLMPNPKNGTITTSPQDVVKKYAGGQISFKTESKTPIIHLTVGKLSFEDKKLLENIKTALDAIQTKRITKVTLKSTMSPGIRVDFLAF